MTDDPDVTLVVTSCGRPDLLFRTLDSLFATEGEVFARKIVAEDSADEAVAAQIQARYPDVLVLLNQPQLGQLRSIDRAYGHVETPYIFHCEDDWLFDGPPVMDQCRRILEAEPTVSVACVRKVEDLSERSQASFDKAIRRDGYRLMQLDAHPEWFSYLFNPGLVRMDLYRRFAPFAPLKAEDLISYEFKKAGFTTAFLEHGSCVHIGDGRHVDDPMTPPKARTFGQKLRRSFEKRIRRLKRALAK